MWRSSAPTMLDRTDTSSMIAHEVRACGCSRRKATTRRSSRRLRSEGSEVGLGDRTAQGELKGTRVTAVERIEEGEERRPWRAMEAMEVAKRRR